MSFRIERPAPGVDSLATGPESSKGSEQRHLRHESSDTADSFQPAAGSEGSVSPVIVQTTSGGLHIYFSLRPGEQPRTRASDNGSGLDTRGEGGYIIAPGNVLPDGARQ